MTPADTPAVSVVVAAWRASLTLPACAKAALAQRGVGVELVIVDDASDDGTFEVAQALAESEPRVRVLGSPHNAGPGAARNRGIEAATGDWIAVLDADDGMTPGRLARMVALAEERGADVVLGNLREVDPDGQPIGDARFLQEPAEPVQWDLEAFVAGNMAASGGRSLGYLKPLIRRDFLMSHGLRYDTSLRNGEDFHLILSCLAAGASLWFSPAPDYLYTRRPGSLSHRSDPAHMKALMAADAAFAARYATRPRLTRLLDLRRRDLADIHTAEVVLQSARRARFGAAAGALLRRPQAARRVVLQLTEAVRKRLGGLLQPR